MRLRNFFNFLPEKTLIAWFQNWLFQIPDSRFQILHCLHYTTLYKSDYNFSFFLLLCCKKFFPVITFCPVFCSSSMRAFFAILPPFFAGALNFWWLGDRCPPLRKGRCRARVRRRSPGCSKHPDNS